MENGKTWNLLFCGIGGQGVLTAAEVSGWAALLAGYRVKKSEVHGMAQRGGSVESHLRFGPEVHSPLIPDGRADFLVSFYQDEHDRLSHYLAPDGNDLLPYLERAEEEVKDRRFRNTYILGSLSAGLPIGQELWLEALQRVIPRAHEENRQAFLAGRAAAGG